MKLLIDFDDAFDNDQFYEQLPAPATAFREVYTPLDAYEESFEGGVYSEDAQAMGEYSLEAMAEDLQDQGVNVTADQIRAAFDHAPQLLYEPALEYVEEVAEENSIDEVVVVSRTSRPAWQRRKIRASGIEKYVDDVVVLAAEPGTMDTTEPVDAPEEMPGYIVDGDDLDLETISAFLSNKRDYTVEGVADYLEGKKNQ